MANYDVEEEGLVDPENILDQIDDLKTLMKIDFSIVDDNILLNEKKFELVIEKILELESRIKTLEKR